MSRLLGNSINSLFLVLMLSGCNVIFNDPLGEIAGSDIEWLEGKWMSVNERNVISVNFQKNFDGRFRIEYEERDLNLSAQGVVTQADGHLVVNLNVKQLFFPDDKDDLNSNYNELYAYFLIKRVNGNIEITPMSQAYLSSMVKENKSVNEFPVLYCDIEFLCGYSDGVLILESNNVKTLLMEEIESVFPEEKKVKFVRDSG